MVERHVVFTPDADFAGVAWFDYVVSDGRLLATGRALVHVAPVNDPPVAYGDQVSVVAGDEVAFHLTAFDIDGDPLAIELLETPAHGALSGAADDKYVYRADGGWSGTDRLVYRVGDAETWSAPVTVELVVTPRS